MKSSIRNRLVALTICAVAVLATIGIWLHQRQQIPTLTQTMAMAPQQPTVPVRPTHTDVPGIGDAAGQATGSDNEFDDSSKPVGCNVLADQTPDSNKASDVTEGNQDIKGGMNCQFRVSDNTPVFTLHFLGRPDNTLGDIEVLQAGKVIQTFTGHAVDLGMLYPAGLDVEVRAVDANFDGYQDLELLNDCGATGNCDYDFYLYDRSENKFVFNKFLSGLGTPEFDAAKKQIKTSWNMAAGIWGSSTFEFRNGEYVEIRRYDSDESGDKTYELKDGKLVLVQSEKGDSQ